MTNKRNKTLARRLDQPDARLQTSVGDADILLRHDCIRPSRLPSHEGNVRSNSFSPEHTAGKLKAELSQTFFVFALRQKCVDSTNGSAEVLNANDSVPTSTRDRCR
jgi:hypothetical protein